MIFKIMKIGMNMQKHWKDNVTKECLFANYQMN